MLGFNHFLFLVNFCLFVQSSSADCPPNSTPGNGNGKCYSFSTTVGDFISAERTCTEFGGHLVSICNAYENALITDAANRKLQSYGVKEFWIGYNDLDNKGSWKWTSNASCPYTNWGSGQPGDEDCASFQISTGKWTGSDCISSKAFVCETYAQKNVTVKPTCREGYSLSDEWNTCYKLFTISSTWNDARASCLKDGGELVSIHSKNEETFVDNLMHQFADVVIAWIGFYSGYPQNTSIAEDWIWTDRTPAIYSDWYPGYPINKFPCAYMVSSGNHKEKRQGNFVPTYWANDNNCSEPFHFYICKQYPICG